MASGVSVERAAVQGGIGCCKVAIHELQTASRELSQSYRQAGSNGWRDQKYAALGGIVEECCSAMTKPISDLEDCMRKLEALLAAISAYEGQSL